jgi:hypothetical protein
VTTTGPEILGLPAASSPATREALTRWRRSVLVTLAIGLACLAGFLVALGFVTAANDQLRQHGARTTGTVYTLYPDTGHSSGHADVRFTVRGHQRFGSVDLGSDADSYAEGQQVTVFYDSADPSRMTIDDEDNQPGWTVLPMVLLLVGGVAAPLVAAVRVVRRRRAQQLLRSASWQPVRVRVLQERQGAQFTVPGSGAWRSRGAVWPTPNREPRKLSGWGLPDEDPRSVPADQPAWWVSDGRRAVFSPDRGYPLVMARPGSWRREDGRVPQG